MLSAFQGLYSLLIFSLALNLTPGVDIGCDDWYLSGQDEVCCKNCKPGNRLVKECGKNPEKLCTPCEAGEYTTRFDYRCWTCKQCIGIQITIKNCTSSSNTVCGCKPGFRCGNDECSFCVTECKKGEEPTSDGLCRKCPEGKFNNKVHSKCINSDKVPATLPVGTNKEQINWLPVFIAAMMAGFALLCILVAVVTYIKAQNKKGKKPEDDSVEEDDSGDSRSMVLEQEDCSFCHPEQEQSGSSESINMDDSKLIV